jgi:hypothetical protein
MNAEIMGRLPTEPISLNSETCSKGRQHIYQDEGYGQCKINNSTSSCYELEPCGIRKILAPRSVNTNYEDRKPGDPEKSDARRGINAKGRKRAELRIRRIRKMSGDK